MSRLARGVELRVHLGLGQPGEQHVSGGTGVDRQDLAPLVGDPDQPDASTLSFEAEDGGARQAGDQDGFADVGGEARFITGRASSDNAMARRGGPAQGSGGVSRYSPASASSTNWDRVRLCGYRYEVVRCTVLFSSTAVFSYMMTTYMLSLGTAQLHCELNTLLLSFLAITPLSLVVLCGSAALGGTGGVADTR